MRYYMRGYHILIISLLVMSLVLELPAVAADNKDTGKGKYIDTHVHLMILREGPQEQTGAEGPFQGPRQKGEMRPPPDRPRDKAGPKPSERSEILDYLAAGENLIKIMDQYGVKKSLLMPPPQIPEQVGRVRNSSAVNLAVVKKHPERFALVAGGSELNPLINGTKPSEVNESIRTGFRREAEKLVESGAKGFGEMSVLHVAMQEKHNYSQAAADHPLFLDLADIAARHNIPIDIHMEAVLSPMETPPFLANVSHNPKTLPATIPAFERLLQHNRKAKIVWQHIGWDNTGNQTPDLLQRLLREHPNLYAALRVEEFNLRMRPFRPNALTGDDGTIKPEWRQLIGEFPDRFMIGSDEFVGIPGVTRRMPKSFALTWALLEQLPSDLAWKIGHENAARVYNLK